MQNGNTKEFALEQMTSIYLLCKTVTQVNQKKENS